MSKPRTVKPPMRGVIVTESARLGRAGNSVVPREGRIFEIFDSEAHLAAWGQQQRDEKDAAALAQREQAREAERARETKSCPSILSSEERRSPRADPELIRMTLDEPDITETCKPVWLTRPPDFFLDQLFEETDILRFTSPGFGSQTGAYGDAKNHIAAYTKVLPNALTIGEEPRRKHIVCRFGANNIDATWKLVSYLTREAHLTMVVYTGSAALEAWVDCKGWSAKKLDDFARLYLRLGGDAAALVSDFNAVLPNALVSNASGIQYQQMHAIGYLRDQSERKARNWVLAFNPPNK